MLLLMQRKLAVRIDFFRVSVDFIDELNPKVFGHFLFTHLDNVYFTGREFILAVI